MVYNFDDTKIYYFNSVFFIFYKKVYIKRTR